MTDEPLHPNLARIAAAYDDIHRRFSVRQIDADGARAEILALQARDDEGVIWRISPDDGSWLRRSRDGQWNPGTPPTSGLATPTAHDLSRDPNLFNPDRNITFDTVADKVDGLHGASRQLHTDQRAASGGPDAAGKLLFAVMMVVGAALVAVLLL